MIKSLAKEAYQKYGRVFILGLFLVGLGSLINKIPELSPPHVQIIDSSNQSTPSSDTKTVPPDDGKINLNTSDQSTIETLPGIGPKTAQKIMTNRPYKEVSDLIGKDVISNSVFEKIKDLISI